MEKDQTTNKEIRKRDEDWKPSLLREEVIDLRAQFPAGLFDGERGETDRKKGKPFTKESTVRSTPATSGE